MFNGFGIKLGVYTKLYLLTVYTLELTLICWLSFMFYLAVYGYFYNSSLGVSNVLKSNSDTVYKSLIGILLCLFFELFFLVDFCY